MNWKEPRASVSAGLLAAATLACLVPFLGKAFHMDDPLFIWAARHIRSHPFDFYSFSVDWGFHETPMPLVMQNPPMAAYYLALTGAALGWSERALHFGFLAPALALVLGTYCMARRFCAHPLAAALATVATPVFLLSSTSVMCDTMMAALWVWAVFFWTEGLEAENPPRLFLAATLMAACGLAKYFGVCLIPLLAAYSALQRRRAGRWLFYFLWPVLILAAFQWMTARLYGRGLLSDAFGIAVMERTSTGPVSRIIETLAFGGGCLFLVLPALPWLWGGKGMIAGVAGMAAAAGLMAVMKKVGGFAVVEGGHVKWLFLQQMSLFVVGGILILALAVGDAMRNRTPASILLLLWVAGVMVFVGGVNWTVSGRNFLPLAPAAAMLIVRRLEVRQNGGLGPFYWPLGLSLAVALTAAWADCRLAGSARDVANRLTSELSPRFHNIVFEGHWGFQYYMEQLGFKPLEREPLRLKSNEVILVPLGNTSLFRLPDNLASPIDKVDVTPAKWLSIQSSGAGAGYYSDGWGPAPFVFGPAPPESYLVVRVK
jgi:4-amino-4-deoxy-L-arabinose transferase-like glycosyltransferase